MKRSHRIALTVWIAGGGAAVAAAQSAVPGTCEQLAAVRLTNTTIDFAEVDSARVIRAAAGGRRGRGAGAGRAAQPDADVEPLPAMCLVTGSIRPTTTSDIRFELWLPLTSWNGKFAGIGNGGWGGVISRPGMAAPFRRGYAVAATNTGHQQVPDRENFARFAFEQPEQLVDYAYRSVHEMTVVAKALVEHYYKKAPAYSYWIGSSTGGKQGFIEAQRYPADYDGILAASPPLHFTTLKAAYLHKLLVAAKDSMTFLPEPMLRVLHDAVMAACDGTDGAKDGVLADPRDCSFQPASMRCVAGSVADQCLSSAQATAVSQIYEGLRTPRTGSMVMHGLSRGSELNWVPETNPDAPNAQAITYFRWLVFRDSTWDWRSFDFGREKDWRVFLDSESKYGPIFNATNSDLRAFEARGGKIIHYHGWNDHQIPAANSIDYYVSVRAQPASGRGTTTSDQGVERFYRLFLAPGRGHGLPPGPLSQLLTSLERWVEQGIAPASMSLRTATEGQLSSQLLCAYPEKARYTGTGDPADAKSFTCSASTRR